MKALLELLAAGLRWAGRSVGSTGAGMSGVPKVVDRADELASRPKPQDGSQRWS